MSTTPLPSDAPQDRGSEQSLEQKAIAGLSQGQLVRRRFFRHKGAMVALVVLVAVILLAFTSVGVVVGGTGALQASADGTLSVNGWRIPGWWPLDWFTAYPVVNGGQPTLSLFPFNIGEHPFGQDTLGKDVFAQVMRGTQQSITVMFLVGIVSLVLGVLLGALSGFFRGWIDALIMRFTDVVIIIPIIVLGSIIGRLLGGNSAVVFGLFLGILSWTGLARLVRGEFLSLREREFVDAARVAGAGDGRIIFRHILPNAVGIIIVNTTLLMSAAVLTEAALSFIGFGISYPDVSLGQIICGVPRGVPDAAVAVLVAGPVHHRAGPLHQLHRRRSARRVRPASAVEDQQPPRGEGAGRHPVGAGRARRRRSHQLR